MTIGDHLRGRPKEVVDLYRRFAEMVRDLGPGVKAVPVKTGIGFMVRVRFAGVALQKRGLRANFWLKDRIDSPRFAKVEFIPPNNFITPFTPAPRRTSTMRSARGSPRRIAWASRSTWPRLPRGKG
jgi:hypothetical protein